MSSPDIQKTHSCVPKPLKYIAVIEEIQRQVLRPQSFQRFGNCVYPVCFIDLVGEVCDCVGLVEKADGRLADSRISGEDVGTAIVTSDKGLAGIDAELAKIDAQLRIPNLAKDVRGRLVERGNDLRDQRRALSGEREDKVEREERVRIAMLSALFAARELQHPEAQFFDV